MFGVGNFTVRLKHFSVWLWSLGLALAAATKISLVIHDWTISWSYAFFFLSAIFCLWAEKREFNTRVFLYRLHELSIYSSFKYLLLYFLWINLFAMFTAEPVKSVLYAASGWFNLLAVAIVPQLIFCERNMRGVALIPSRLKIAFSCFVVSQIILLFSVLLPIFFPGFPVPVLVRDPLDLFLYFMIGFPFLLWDFGNKKGMLLPRYLSGLCIVLGVVTVILLGRRFFILSLGFCVFLYFAIAVYKQLRLKAFLLSTIFLCAASLTFFFFVDSIPEISPMKERILTELSVQRGYLEQGLSNSAAKAFEIARSTRYLGVGVGVSSLKGVWTRVFAEAGSIGFLLYAMFFLSLLKNLYRIRHERRIVVSNIAFISTLYFLFFGSHYLANPYAPAIWVWYAIWFLFAATKRKKELVAL